MSTPLVIRDRNTMRNLILTNQTMGRRIGFVPTMGSLHAGHTSLVDRAMAECDDVATSIFVNPSQFGPQEDFERYPRDFDADFNLLAQHDVRWIFAPDVHEMYPPGDSTRIEISGPAEPYEVPQGRYPPLPGPVRHLCSRAAPQHGRRRGVLARPLERVARLHAREHAVALHALQPEPCAEAER